MPIATGLALAGIGAGLATGLANTGTNIWSQKDAQAFNAQEALKAREFSSAEAQKQREFEERMSNTSYQRALADMKAAGVNPNVLGAGGGASTPSASIPSAAAAESPSSRPGAFDFNSIFSAAAQLAAASDKTVMNKIIAEMYANNSLQMNQANLAFRQSANAAKLDFLKDKEQFNQDFKKVQQMDKNAHYNKDFQEKHYWKSRGLIMDIRKANAREKANEYYRERSYLWRKNKD